MLLQHHYGQHLFGDDYFSGARVTIRVHRRTHHHHSHRRRDSTQLSQLEHAAGQAVAEAAREIATAEERLGEQLTGGASDAADTSPSAPRA